MMYLVDDSYNQSCREILSSKKKIKWCVYNKSALIGTKKKKKPPKRIFQGPAAPCNWFYSDCGWFHRLWALENSVKYLPLKHSAIQTEPLIVIQNEKKKFICNFSFESGFKSTWRKKEWEGSREEVKGKEVLNSQKTWGKETIKNEYPWNQNLREWSAQFLGEMTPWLSHPSISKPFCLSSLLTSFPRSSFLDYFLAAWQFGRKIWVVIL